MLGALQRNLRVSPDLAWLSGVLFSSFCYISYGRLGGIYGLALIVVTFTGGVEGKAPWPILFSVNKAQS